MLTNFFKDLVLCCIGSVFYMVLYSSYWPYELIQVRRQRIMEMIGQNRPFLVCNNKILRLLTTLHINP